MALHKENYGLIYNDDGSLCVTLRKDDVPFEGVTSFAVEEGTTNLVPNTNGRPNTMTPGGTTPPTVQLVTEAHPWGTEAWKVTFPAGASTSYSGCRVTSDNWTMQKDGREYTFSVYIKGDTSKLYICHYVLAPMLASGPAVGGYQRYVATVSLTGGGTSDEHLTIFLAQPTSTDITIYVVASQVEEKPFATSFTEGTRADGRLAIPINFRTNLVISGWFKPYGTSGNYSTQGGWARIVNFSNSDDTRRVTLAYNRIGSHPDFQKFMLSIYNASGDAIVTTSNVYPLNKWYFWVLIIEDASATAYIFDENGNMEKIVNTNSIPISDISSSPLYIGHRTVETTDVLNGVISNLLIATYDPAIWTDEYIRTIYQAKKPFAVPPKLPIV